MNDNNAQEFVAYIAPGWSTSWRVASDFDPVSITASIDDQPVRAELIDIVDDIDAVVLAQLANKFSNKMISELYSTTETAPDA